MAKAIGVSDFRKALKSGRFAPVYVALGGDPLLLDDVVLTVRDSVDEATRDFNLDVFYGDDIDATSLAGALSALPMMAERRSVLVKRAGEMSPSLRNYLVDYVKRPVESTLLVLLIEGDGKNAWIQKLTKQAVTITCAPPRGKALQAWVQSHVKGLGVDIAPDVLDLITEGRNIRLIDLAGELEKAALLVEEGGTITLEIIQQVWGIQPEINIWQFFDRVASGRRLAALRDLVYMRESMGKDQGEGFVFSQVARRWRLAWKEKGYDRMRVPFANREWAGNTKRQWQMASSDLKSIPQEVAEQELARMLDLDRARKSSSVDALLAFERLIHRTALDREGGHG